MKLRLLILCAFTMSCGLAFSQTYNQVLWQQKDGPVGGRVTDIEYDASSGLVFAIAGAQRRLYISDDEGATWTRNNGSGGSFSFFNDIEITNNTVYLTTSSGVWSSTDGGDIFNAITSNHFDFNNANRIVRLSTGRLIILGNNGIHYSTNNGSLWTLGYQPSGFLNPRWLANNSADQLFIVKDNRPYRSNDFGVNFTEFSSGIPVGEQVHSLVRNTAGNGIYCVTGTNIYVSDGSSAWTSIKGGDISDAVISEFGQNEASFLEFSADGAGMYFVDNSNQKLYAKGTGDGPASWQLRQSDFPTTTVDIVNASAKDFPTASTSTVFFGATNGFYKTTSGATTFSSANSGFSGVDPKKFLAHDFGNVYMHAGENTILRSSDNGDGWSELTSLSVQTIYDFIQNSTRQMLYVATDDGPYRSFDGNFWEAITLPGGFTTTHLYAPDENKLFAQSGRDFYYSSDQGSNWTAFPVAVTGLPSSIGLNDLVFASPDVAILHLRDFDNDVDKVYSIAMTYVGNLLLSATGTDITANIPIDVEQISDLYAADGNVYAVTFNDALALSEDEGVNWQERTIGSVSDLFVAYNGYIFTTESGINEINISRDGGATFQATTLGPTASINDIQAIEIDGQGIAYLAFRDNFIHATTKTIVTPDAPSDIIEVGNIGTAVALSWKDNSDNEEQFDISSSIDGVNFTSVGTSFDNFCTTPDDRAFHTIPNLNPDTDYTIRVVARNEAGTSAPAEIDILTTPNECTTTIPDNKSWSATNAQESGLPASGTVTIGIIHLGNGKYQISDMSLGILSGSPFFINGEMPGIFYENCGETIVDAGDNDLKPNGKGTWDGTTLKLKWRTCEADEYETISLTVNGIDPVPDKPENALAYVLTESSIEVNWRTSYFQSEFVVERSLDGSTGWTELGTVNYPQKRFIDNGPLSVGTTYFYRVKAVNGNPTPSLYSNVTSVEFSIPRFLLADNAITNTVAASLGSYSADFNGDGFDDYLTMAFDPASESGSPVIFQNNGDGDFTAIPISLDNQPYFLGAVADYDNDGKIDMIFHGQEFSISDLYKGNGNFTFTKVSTGTGDLMNVTAEDIRIQSSSWGDINNDGLLDLLVLGSRQTEDNQGIILLYRQNPNHTFSKIPGGDMADDTDRSTGAFWSDYNNDGFQDVLITNSNGPCRLYENNGNDTFTETSGNGLDANQALTVAWGDYNNDGHMDIFATNSTQHALYRNNGNETFTKNVTTSVSQTGQAIGVSWADFNNDGYLDLFTSGFIGVPARLFMRDATIPSVVNFTLIDNEKLNDFSIMHYGNSVSDFDQDGHVDIAMSAFEFGTDDQVGSTNIPLFNNNIHTGNWSEVKLNPILGNKGGFGARVTLQAGGITQIREFPTNSSIVSRSTNTAHFGIGSATTITSIQVKWANGDIQTYLNPPRNQVIVIDQDNQGPAIVTRSPLHEAASINTTATISFTLNETSTAVAAKNLYITPTAGGPAVFTMSVTSAAKSGNQYTFTLPGKLLPLTEYEVTLDAGAFVDKYSNQALAINPAEWTFTTIAAPDALSLSPAHNSTGIASNTDIKITMNGPTTAVAGKFLLLYLNSNLASPITGVDLANAVQVGNEFTFTLAQKLEPNTRYNISVDAGAFVDANGNESLEFPTGLWTFTTAPGPTISTLFPAHNAVAVPSNTTLAITFSEAVEAAAGKTVKVFEASDLITPVFTLNADDAVITGSTATFSLPELLETGTVYSVSMDAGAFYSSNGENDVLPITASSWSFTTSSGPQVTVLSPLHNATGIDADTDLAITFGVDINTVAAKSIKIFKTTDLVTPVETLDAASGSISGQTITYALTNLLDRASTYTITIDPGAIVSVVGSNSYAGMVSGTWSFTTSAGPQVTTLAPVHSATGVDADTDLEITFDENVTAVSGKVIRVFESSDLITPVQTLNANTGTMVGQTVTYNLTGVLSRATSYTVIVDEGAFISVAGSNDFAGIGSGSWSFTTSQGPTTSTLVPAIGSSGIFQNTGLAITFAEDVNAVTAKTIRIYKSSDAVNPVETLNATDGVKSSFTFTYTISPKLERATIYNVVIDEGAFVSVSGSNGFSGITSGIWSFTTSDGPQLATRVPIHGATGVFANTQLAVTFNETVTAAANKTLKVFRSTDQATAVHTLNAADGVITGQTVTFTLPAKLDRATAYNVSIDAGAFVSTVGSNDFEGSASSQWSFTTDAGPTATFEPTNASSNVAVTAQLRLSFSRDIDRAIAGKRIRVMNGSTAIVNLDVSNNGTLAARTYTLNAPTGNWPFGSQLEVLVDPGAFVDTDENDFEGVAAGEWRFSIVEAPDATAPAINFTPIATTLEKNFSPVNISATVTDNKTVVSTILWHRKISEKNFTNTVLTFNSTNDTWEGQILSSFADDMGFEYYLEASDGPNTARLPLTANTYFKTTLTFNGVNAPSLSLPSGGTKSSWKIISVPYTLAAPQISTIFDQFPITDKTKWRMIRYTETPSQGWQEYPNNFSSIERGKGYFINTKDGGTVTLDDASAPGTYSRDNLFEMNLDAGWNQIGNPYTATINWNDVKAYNSTLQVGDLHRFQGGSYTNNPGDEQLPVMQGGFVEVETAMVIKIPFAGQNIPGDGRKGFKDLGGDINADQWALSFNLEQGQLAYGLGSIGMAKDASVSRDIYDASTPPRFFDYLEINFAHPEYFQKRFTRDVVPTQEQYAWEFTVATNQEGIAELQWDNDPLVGSSKDLFLLDVSRQKLVNMKETNSYLFDPKESATFRVYFGENLNIAPEGVELGKAYPNPTSGYTVIAFSLPETGGTNQSVSLELLDAMGRTMGIITQGRLNPGYHEAGFDTKDMTGGFYTYRLSVQGIKGRTTKVNKLIIK